MHAAHACFRTLRPPGAWAILSAAAPDGTLQGNLKHDAFFLRLTLASLQVGRDPRPVMRAAYECFRTGSDPGAILLAAAPEGTPQGKHDAFYSQLVR